MLEDYRRLDGAVVLINKKNCILNEAVCLRRIVCLTVLPIRGVCSGLIAVLAELFEEPPVCRLLPSQREKETDQFGEPHTASHLLFS